MEFQHTSDSDSGTDEEDQDIVMVVGVSANHSAPKRKTLKLQGLVAGQEVLILVDSRSVATFVSEQLAK